MQAGTRNETKNTLIKLKADVVAKQKLNTQQKNTGGSQAETKQRTGKEMMTRDRLHSSRVERKAVTAG